MAQAAGLAKAAFNAAAGVVGSSTLSIDSGTGVSAIENTPQLRKDFESGAFEGDSDLELVCRSDQFRAAYPDREAQIHKLATWNSKSWRVVNIGDGGAFTILSLVEPEKGE